MDRLLIVFLLLYKLSLLSTVLLALIEPGEKTLTVENGADSGKRNRNKDTYRTEKFTADNDGYQGNKGRHSKRISEEMRLNDVAIDRLQNQGKDDEDQHIHRIFE